MTTQHKKDFAMTAASLEHINFTVPDPHKTARWMCELFGWHIRWSGGSIHGGQTVHVGSDTSYLALYTGPGADPKRSSITSYEQIAGFNHVGITVDDLDATEEKVKSLGFNPKSHADYEPGRRFYFDDDDGVEYEIVSYR